MAVSVLNINEKNCCGCESCAQICPQHCIIMQENQRGFLVPIVNIDKCINCGACLKACPEQGDSDLNDVVCAYAAIARDRNTIKASTSGGIFRLLSSYVIRNGGVVYGCAWKDDFTVHHVRINDVSNLWEVQQSKYIQSSADGMFISAKKDLEHGLTVLYSGTGCQIAGLKKYLRKDFDNLYTVEVACHGVPSQGLFKKYIKWLEKKQKQSIVKYQFRSKDIHKKGEHYKFTVEYSNGSKKSYFSYEDSYYGSFLEARTLRETCYNCKYKQEKRIGDILLSDFWGIEKEHKQFPSANGASAVVICSKKGHALIEKIKGQMIFEETSFEQIIAHNISIVSSASCDKNMRLLSIQGDDDALFSSLKPDFNIIRRVKDMIPEGMKYWLKQL